MRTATATVAGVTTITKGVQRVREQPKTDFVVLLFEGEYFFAETEVGRLSVSQKIEAFLLHRNSIAFQLRLLEG